MTGTTPIRPGEVYFADAGGSAGRRPVIIVSRESLNRGTHVVVVPCTTQRLAVRRALPNCVPFRVGQFGLTRECVAQCEAVDRLPIVALDPTPVGRLDAAATRKLTKAIGNVIDADCEPV